MALNQSILRLGRAMGLFNRGLCSVSYNSEASIARQNELFDNEKKRQLEFVKRVEKIQVNHVGPNDACKLLMNKDLSTPYHVAMHLHERYTRRSVMAMVNGHPWHMLQPLTEDCDIGFLTMKEEEPEEVNRVFWRASAHMLGALLMDAFKEAITVVPVRAPEIPYVMGCFAYDVNLSVQWEPTRQELTSLKRLGYKMCYDRIPFERLAVRREVAEDIFQHNEYKRHHLEHVTTDRVTLFRLGKFIDISDGPMLTDTGLVAPFHFSITKVHSIDDFLLPNSKLSRFQAVALPPDFKAHHTTFAVLEDRARRPDVYDAGKCYINKHLGAEFLEVLLDLKPDYEKSYVQEQLEAAT